MCVYRCISLYAVHKFRRRPQYLEYFVHLATAGVEQGQHHLVLEWAQETFTWLARWEHPYIFLLIIVCVCVFRRNELILTTRPVHVAGKPHPPTARHRKRTVTPSHPHTSTTTTTNTHSAKTTSALGDSHKGKPHPPTKTTSTTCKTTPTTNKSVVRYSGTHAKGGSSRQGRISRRGELYLFLVDCVLCVCLCVCVCVCREGERVERETNETAGSRGGGSH